MIENIKHIIEAIIFASDEPVSMNTLIDTISAVNKIDLSKDEKDSIFTSIDELNKFYEENEVAFRIIKLAGGYQFATIKDFSKYVGYLNTERNKRRLSQQGLETLAIIAYKQPITKPELEKIRGVNSDYILTTLLEKNLICIKGRAETVGRPLLYETTQEFLNYFGINDIKDLPRPREITEIMNDEEFIEQRRKILMNNLEEEIEKQETDNNEDDDNS